MLCSVNAADWLPVALNGEHHIRLFLQHPPQWHCRLPQKYCLAGSEALTIRINNLCFCPFLRMPSGTENPKLPPLFQPIPRPLPALYPVWPQRTITYRAPVFTRWGSDGVIRIIAYLSIHSGGGGSSTGHRPMVGSTFPRR